MDTADRLRGCAYVSVNGGKSSLLWTRPTGREGVPMYLSMGAKAHFYGHGLPVERVCPCAQLHRHARPTAISLLCACCRYDEKVASFANAAGVGVGGNTLIGGAEGAPQVRQAWLCTLFALMCAGLRMVGSGMCCVLLASSFAALLTCGCGG